MNERIKELARTARGQMAVLTTVDDEQWRQHEEFVGKFAELIAGKCCAILNEMHSWQTMNNQEYSSNWHDAVDQGIEHIKEQFGVEE
jgi:hypothetical protein